MSFYWAIGGTAGLGTLGDGIRELTVTRDPQFITVVWITGVIKVVGGLLALALVRPWGRWFPRWMLLTGAWGAGVALLLYGVKNYVAWGLIAVGVLGVPEAVDWASLSWYLLLWDPWWLIGGALFVAAAGHYNRTTRDERGRVR